MIMDAEKSQSLQSTSWGPGPANGVSSSPRQKKTDVPLSQPGWRRSVPVSLLFYSGLQPTAEAHSHRFRC